MTKKDLKKLIQECIKEVINENEFDEVPADKQAAKLEAWKQWGNLMKMLKDIHAEQSTINQLNSLRKATFDADLTRHDFD
jgi:hypothetical protein